MSKRIVMAALFLGSLTTASVVFAEDPPKDAKKAPTKEEGQAKVDAAKVDVCEKGKKFLTDQKAKGKCAAEADEAGKITCTAATSKSVTDLMTKCTAAKPADAKTDKPAADPATPAATPKCHAVETADPTKVLGEAEDKLTTKCSRMVMDKVKEAKCADAANKGKKIEYTVQFDQMIGTGKLAKKVKDAKQSFTCPKK